MRNIILSSLLIPWLCSGLAQLPDIQVISSSGSSYILNNIQLDWTLGEAVVQTMENSTTITTNGFHQPMYELVSIKNLPAEIGTIETYPNPVVDVLKIKMNFLAAQNGVIELYDLGGIKIWNKPFDGKTVNEELVVSHLPSGQYLLGVTINQLRLIEPFNIIKIQ